MSLIENFFVELDRAWKRPPKERIPLRVIGSAALMLRTDYERRTKDGDVIETDDLTEEIKKELLGVAGQGTDMHRRWNTCLDIVIRGLPFFPQRPQYHPIPGLSPTLRDRRGCFFHGRPGRRMLAQMHQEPKHGRARLFSGSGIKNRFAGLDAVAQEKRPPPF